MNSFIENEGSMLIAIADNDDQKDLTSKEILRKAFGDARVAADRSVQGRESRWMPPD